VHVKHGCIFPVFLMHVEHDAHSYILVQMHAEQLDEFSGFRVHASSSSCPPYADCTPALSKTDLGSSNSCTPVYRSLAQSRGKSGYPITCTSAGIVVASSSCAHSRRPSHNTSRCTGAGKGISMTGCARQQVEVSQRWHVQTSRGGHQFMSFCTEQCVESLGWSLHTATKNLATPFSAHSSVVWHKYSSCTGATRALHRANPARQHEAPSRVDLMHVSTESIPPYPLCTTATVIFLEYLLCTRARNVIIKMSFAREQCWQSILL
jgi:hypothetical protein